MKTDIGKRQDYKWFHPMTSRWSDNDRYGHFNNVVYYSFFDTAVNHYLIAEGGLDIDLDPIIGIVPESGCRYFRSAAYPDAIEAGLRVGKLGNSSVRYELGIFLANEDQPLAEGFFVHVFVDRLTQRPVPMPEKIRQALSRLQ